MSSGTNVNGAPCAICYLIQVFRIVGRIKTYRGIINRRVYNIISCMGNSRSMIILENSTTKTL